MKNKLMISGVTAVVIGVIYIAFLYPWPVGQGTEGTIGGVKKYNAHQLAEKDVQLQDITTGTVDKDMIIAFYNSAPLADREAFERSRGMERTADGSYQRSADGSYQRSADASYERSASSDLQKTTNSDLNRTASSDLQKTTNSDLNRTASSDLQKTTNSDLNRSAGSDLQRTSASDLSRSADNMVERSASSLLERSLGFWNQAPMQSREQFAKSWLEKSQGFEKSQGQE
jgi:hypothetical protein